MCCYASVGATLVVARSLRSHFEEKNRCQQGCDEQRRPCEKGEQHNPTFALLNFSQGATSKDKARGWAFEWRYNDGAAHTGLRLPGNSIFTRLPHIIKNPCRDGRRLTIEQGRRGNRFAICIKDNDRS